MTTAAVVQDWFFASGGSEEVAIEIAGLLPQAEVYTSFMEAGYRDRLTGHPIHTWPLQRLLGPTRRYRSLLPLYPIWFGNLDLRSYDLVISSSSAFAKGVKTRPGALHVAYVHSPMRYAWEQESYLANSSVGLLGSLAARAMRPWLRSWDRRAGQRPDVLVANSNATRHRIREYWGRDAEVIYPPVPVEEIEVSNVDDGFLLVAARMLGYRRLDLAIESANRLGRELVVVGDGPERARLQRAAGPTIRFIGRVDRPALRDLFARCHAYLVPGVEDFGMAPVEAMAAGKPVVAFAGGGALDTVINGRTGILFSSQTADGMADAIKLLDGLQLDRGAIRAGADRFATSVFREAFVSLLSRHGVDGLPYRRSALAVDASVPTRTVRPTSAGRQPGSQT